MNEELHIIMIIMFLIGLTIGTYLPNILMRLIKLTDGYMKAKAKINSPCNSCNNGHNGTNGNGYQPHSDNCKLNR